MDNITVNRASENGEDKNDLELLLTHKGFEIMVHDVKKDSFTWITPSDNEDAIEFVYILSGDVTLEGDGEKIELSKGDSFYYSALAGDIVLNTKNGFRFLYVSTVQTFNYLENFSGYLEDILKRIEDKDNYTYGHSKRVMEYSLAIAREMNLSDVSIDDIIIASAFHDVGKCYISDDIIKKEGKLSNDEYSEMKKHSLNSSKILEGKFSKSILKIIEMHHERIDGSGYPFGKTDDEIPFEAKIIAVADSFDAMTSDRSYNLKKTFEYAADELVSMSNKYDVNIALALRKLVYSKRLYERHENND